jgi:hypothetical protein
MNRCAVGHGRTVAAVSSSVPVRLTNPSHTLTAGVLECELVQPLALGDRERGELTGAATGDQALDVVLEQEVDNAESVIAQATGSFPGRIRRQLLTAARSVLRRRILYS